MQSTKYIMWEEAGQWCGYLQDYPDLMTQGESFEDLQVKLRHLQHDLASGNHDRFHNPPSTMIQQAPRRIKANDQLEKLFLTMLSQL